VSNAVARTIVPLCCCQKPCCTDCINRGAGRGARGAQAIVAEWYSNTTIANRGRERCDELHLIYAIVRVDRWAAGANHTPYYLIVASVPAPYLLATPGGLQVLGFCRLSRYLNICSV
jgi:hypothetical protein